ncbi:hypothetical protein ACLK19_25335 [Escherichia coli]
MAGIFVVERNSRKAGTACAIAHATTNVQHRFLRFCQHLAHLLNLACGKVTSFSTVAVKPRVPRSPLANWISFGISTRTDQDDLSWQRRMLSHNARQLFQQLHQKAVLGTG